MDASKYYQSSSKLLKAEDLKTDRGYAEVEVEVHEIFEEEMSEGSETRIKLSLGFKGRDKRLLLNVTNYRVLEGAFTSETQHWLGKMLVIHVDPYVQYQGSIVPGLRIRVAGAPSTDDIPF